MSLDPQIKPLVDLVNAGAAVAPPLAEQTVEERRDAYHKLLASLPPGPVIDHVENRVIPGPAGQLGVRIYRPENAVGLMVFFHGGGWVIGDLDSHDEVCRQMAIQAQCAVVSVDYRRGPEARFPAAVLDCYAALTWATERRAELVGANEADDPKVVVCGDSAGGNLAAVVCLMARDQEGPSIAAQLLVYPAVDLRMSEFDSLTTNGEGYVLTRESMLWFGQHYLAEAGQAADWRASPLLADSLAGLPPALVITAEFDPLRDEGAAYAAALADAGVETTHSHYDGMVHIFFQLGPMVDAAARAVAEVAAAAKKCLA